MKRALTIAVLALALLWQASAQTVLGNGGTSDIASGGVFPAAIGSPAAGNLVVLMVSCYDISLSDVIVVTEPSGWTRELHVEHSSTYGSYALLWKVASGSEGATLNVTVGMYTSECVSWYWKLSDYNVSDPLDLSHTGWTASATIDPPNQTFASGPRDGVVLAFAHFRGDVAWVSGPSGLSSGNHISAPEYNLAAGRTAGVGWQAFTNTSAVDPGAVAFDTGDGHAGGAITAVVYGAAASGGFSPLTGPTVLPGSISE